MFVQIYWNISNDFLETIKKYILLNNSTANMTVFFKILDRLFVCELYLHTPSSNFIRGSFILYTTVSAKIHIVLY